MLWSMVAELTCASCESARFETSTASGNRVIFAMFEAISAEDITSNGVEDCVALLLNIERVPFFD